MDFRKEDFEVRSIPSEDCKEWFLYKHYAHRLPSISFAFGLYRGGQLEAVCSYGMPASPSLMKAFGEENTIPIYELNRLCANEGLPRNALSFFVGQTLQMLPKPMVLVSYADSGHNHHGYIYQATNWIYTGLSEYRVDNQVKGQENKHGRHLGVNGKFSYKSLVEAYGEENVIRIERSRKHRYFYLLGSKTERKRMRKLLAYEEQPYPKGDNVRYDASYEVKPQGLLF